MEMISGNFIIVDNEEYQHIRNPGGKISPSTKPDESSQQEEFNRYLQKLLRRLESQ
jgi:hypothetical protein